MKQKVNPGVKQGKKNKQSLLLKIIISLSVLTLTVGGLGTIKLYGFVQNAPELEDDAFHYPNSSTVYDQNGEEMIHLSSGEHRDSVTYDEIPKRIKDAFIAIEDVRFHDHSGIDFKRIGGAVVANLVDGFGSEGGSTITQQVVKNSLLTSEKTIERKVQEAFLALELEKEMSKEKILELYLNKIYFGNGAYGINTAADVYFNKEVDELTIGEAALLAGLPQRPSGYDPYQYPDLAEERRNTVLMVMNNHGFITDQEYQEAKKESIEKIIQEKSQEEEISDAFMDRVYKDLEEMDGIDASMIYNGGLKIYTTYDQKAQSHVDEVLRSDAFISYPDERFQAGVILLDNQTGEIKAIGGGRNQESGKSRSNYATNIQRSPGSAIKPILSYGPAIEHLHWSTYQQIEDEKMTYTGSNQVIHNYNDQYHGVLSMREALKQSWNIPAVKAFKKVGTERAREFAENLGISFEGNMYESFALGSLREGISPLELAGAYAAFANKGVYNEPHTIRKVVFPDGKEILMKPESIQAMSDYTSYMVTDMLKTVVEEGTGQNAQIDGVSVAGKTGTTNFNEETKQKYAIPEEGVPDVWFAGYTSQYTASVWTGYPRTNTENYIKTREDRQIAQKIFKEVMKAVVGDETTEFVKPDSVNVIKIDKKTGKRVLRNETSQNVVTELFVSGTSIKDSYSLVRSKWEKQNKAKVNATNQQTTRSPKRSSKNKYTQQENNKAPKNTDQKKTDKSERKMKETEVNPEENKEKEPSLQHDKEKVEEDSSELEEEDRDNPKEDISKEEELDNLDEKEESQEEPVANEETEENNESEQESVETEEEVKEEDTQEIEAGEEDTTENEQESSVESKEENNEVDQT